MVLNCRRASYFDDLEDEDETFIRHGVMRADESDNFPTGCFNLDEPLLDVEDVCLEENDWEETLSFGRELFRSSREVLKRLDITVHEIISLRDLEEACVFRPSPVFV